MIEKHYTSKGKMNMAVSNKAAELGVKSPVSVVARALHLLEKGLSTRQVAAEIGKKTGRVISHKTIWEWNNKFVVVNGTLERAGV